MIEDGKNYEEKRSVVMEGMYKGMTGKIEEVRQSVSKELQFSSAQQVSAYESLAGALRQGLESLFAELRYLSQQNSAIYDYNQKERAAAQEAIAAAVSAKAEETVRACAEQIEKATQELDERFSERLEALRAELQTERAAEPEETAAEAPAAAEYEEDRFDYDLLAEKIASVLPEPDYDMLADRVAAAVPQTDPDAIADRVAGAVPQTDADAIADRVAEAVAPVDYDLIAERVSSALENEFDVTVDEGGVSRIAAAVAEALDYEKIARRVADLLRARPVYAASAFAAGPVRAAEEVSEVAEAEPMPAEEAAEEELAVSAAPAAVAAADDPAMTTRLKRSFRAKIIESDAEVKEYYFAAKNEFLSYAKVSSQISWTNDRFSYQGETIAKVGVRGKTLCLYLALNPDEFPSSVYHQKFAGDTKMYEKTPMMVKIKSGVACKRALRLVAKLMETLGAVREERKPVDYSGEFAYRSEQQLLADGLIKTALVEKSDLDF